ncbi:MAG: hypothetical protein ABJP90_01550 [Paracoccaceae bacterium]
MDLKTTGTIGTMEQQNTDPSAAFVAAFRKPSWVVVMVCQLLLGLALLITLVVKLYMLVLSEHGCTADGETLGNMIRCISTTELLANFIITLAGFRLVNLLFDPAIGQVLNVIFLALCGALLQFLSRLDAITPNWQAAMMLLSFVASLSVLYFAQLGLTRKFEKRSETSNK